MPTSRRLPLPNHRTLLVLIILLLAFGLRVLYLTEDRFHADEALYAGWALRLLDGDPLLLGVPVDKPPLFLYALAGAFKLFGPSEVAARWINIACSMVGIALIYRLSRLIDRQTSPTLNRPTQAETAAVNAGGTQPATAWAAMFLACSPFDILFARTAFTDSMLVMWMLAALCAALQANGIWAGLFAGLAFATKQHAVILVPLIVVVQGWSGTHRCTARVVWAMLASIIGFFIPWGIVTWWDSARWPLRPGYWQQSALSYGGLVWAPVGEWGARFVEWLGWARHLTGSTVSGLAFVIGVILLLIWSWHHHPRTRQTWLDTLWTAFALAYLVVHSLLAFSIWDRYLLPLTVPVALLSARLVTCADRALGGKAWRELSLTGFTSYAIRSTQYAIRSMRYAVRALRLALPYLVVALAVAFGIRAATNGYPIGGEHWAYQGIDQVAAYLKGNAAPDAVLYHHWLRWHYTYYLHGTTFELRWWRDGAHLRQEARKSPDREQYIVLPSWRPLDPTIDGVRFAPLLETHHEDGSTSLLLCRVELDPGDS